MWYNLAGRKTSEGGMSDDAMDACCCDGSCRFDAARFARMRWRQGKPNQPIIQPPSGQTGIVEGRLVTGSSTTGKSRQVATRFRARVHGLETENTFGLQIRTNGEFRIEGVPVGEQVISIEDEESQQGAVIVCFVRPGQVTNVGDVVPQPLGMIAGFVRTTDENGQLKPVPRARIIARPISDESDTVEELPARPFFTTITDKNGSYRLLVPEGTYLVEARHPDYEPASETVTVKVLEVTPLNFTLVPLPRETGTVYGTVMAQVDGNLIPVPGALVMLKPQGTPEPVISEKLTVGQLISEQMNPTQQGFVPPGPPIHRRLFTFTKADGSFELTGVPAGTYTAIAFKLGYGRDEKQVEVKTGEKVRVDFVLQAQFGTIYWTSHRCDDRKSHQRCVGCCCPKGRQLVDLERLGTDAFEREQETQSPHMASTKSRRSTRYAFSIALNLAFAAH
jgi:hypothetical protein